MTETSKASGRGLEISTRHVSQETADLFMEWSRTGKGPVEVSERPDGCLLALRAPSEDEGRGMPEDLRLIVDLARREGCETVTISLDGPSVEGLWISGADAGPKA